MLIAEKPQDVCLLAHPDLGEVNFYVLSRSVIFRSILCLEFGGHIL